MHFREKQEDRQTVNLGNCQKEKEKGVRESLALS